MVTYKQFFTESYAPEFPSDKWHYVGELADATKNLRELKKFKKRYQPSDTAGAIAAAAAYAKEQNNKMYVYGGNSYMHFIWRITYKKSEVLSVINNTGSAIFVVTPDLTIYRYNRVKPRELTDDEAKEFSKERGYTEEAAERIKHPITGKMTPINRNGKTPKNFWSYQTDYETPSLATAIAAGAIKASTTEAEWDKLSPGFKREIVRSATRKRVQEDIRPKSKPKLNKIGFETEANKRKRLQNDYHEFWREGERDGIDAYHADKGPAIVHNPKVEARWKQLGYSTDEGNAYAFGYGAGWTRANLAAPVNFSE